MNIVYGSPRATTDVDFSTPNDPADYAAQIQKELDHGLARAASRLGYTDLICKTQKIETKPREFPDACFPALKVTIGSAERGTNAENRLDVGQATDVLRLDINFNEPVEGIEAICLDPTGHLQGYSLNEVLSEKIRAFLQQKIRNRARRQDVYDLAFLIDRFPLDDNGRAEVLRMLKNKAEARDITPTPASLSDPDLIERAQRNWQTMQQELDEQLPDFSACYATVEGFYRSLPWD